FGFAENTDDLFVGKTLLHGDVLMWLMKTLLTSGCTNQRGAGQGIENRDHMGLLREVGIWGLQGYLFKSVPFKNVDLLL
ncbi:hypothetical protein N8Z01_26070, partial [Enterobacter hormaechei subsp. hoffmannii]|nr:hypothetical protein [Enterobacter hormaechei subsp. hoffmannii]MCU3685874.1 hypothetical protein [Enterobacter hormaechei subsp. hoffmannii]MCU3700117.1 hypothetical protein [Enterobacter hormaechei subsp. hoffmannii]